MFRVLSFISAFILFFCATPAFAQFGSIEMLTGTLTPQYPRPYDLVTLTIQSTQIDLSRSTITVYANGAVIEKGHTDAEFRVGAAGSKTVVRVVASGGDGTFEKTFTIIPAEVSLYPEPASTVPAFYKGAAQTPPNGSLRIVALADLRVGGARLSNSQIAYTWKLGDQVLQSASGLGKNVLTATAPERYRNADITVTAADQSGTVSAQAGITISPSDPIVRVYQNDPLQGVVLEHALSGTLSMAGAEETLRAVGYFFNNPPTISWTLNNTVSGGDKDITLRSNGGSGTAVIGVSAKDADTSADQSLSVKFGQGGTGVFGF